MKTDDTKLICDGELIIVRITEDIYDEVLELYKNYFLKNENICNATNLIGIDAPADDWKQFILPILQEGISFAAKSVASNEVVSFSINKMLKPSAGFDMDLPDETTKTSAMLFIDDYLKRMKESYNLFKEWNIDCAVEILMLSTRPDFAKRGLAAKLSQHSIDFVRSMNNGTLTDPECLPPRIRDIKPQAVCSVFTSNYSQRIGEKLGLETVFKISNKEFQFEGKSFADRIDTVHEYSTYAAMRL